MFGLFKPTLEKLFAMVPVHMKEEADRVLLKAREATVQSIPPWGPGRDRFVRFVFGKWLAFCARQGTIPLRPAESQEVVSLLRADAFDALDEYEAPAFFEAEKIAGAAARVSGFEEETAIRDAFYRGE